MSISETNTIRSNGEISLGLGELGLCKVFGQILPMSVSGEEWNQDLIASFANARKFGARLLAACELKFASNPQAFKKVAKTYLSSKRCLLAALLEDNGRQKIKYRLSLVELRELSTQYDVLKCLDEPATIKVVPKSSGFGSRQITAFGPAARAAQRMVTKLIRITYQPQRLQLTDLGSAQKVQRATKLIEEKGYSHVLEIDIKDFFPSFNEEDLVNALPLPKEATRQIILAKSAKWQLKNGQTNPPHILPPPGIPQGSVSSNEVAHWCIAQMQMENLGGCEAINHVDNFFVLAPSQKHLEIASKALSSGIAGLPGGGFTGKVEQSGEVLEGFRMLGCWISVRKSGAIRIDPTETNLQKLTSRTQRLRQRVNALLTAANFEGDKKLRVEGLQEFLRLESLCDGWVGAFKFCGEHIKCIESDLSFELETIRLTYEIGSSELGSLRDASTFPNIN